MNEDILKEIEQMRIACKQNDDKRDANLPLEIPEVTRIDDLSYGPDPKWHLLDLYLPKNVQKNIPVIVHIHGGGWVYGTKETYQFYGMSLAKEGFAFVNFTYRLGPDVAFPGILEDVDLVMRWLCEHANQYYLDLNNVFLAGDSAGGQMVEQYLAILTNENYRQHFNFELPDLTVRAAALNCGAYFIHLPGNLQGAVTGYFTKEAQEKYREVLNVEKYLTKNLPPLFIMSSNKDFLYEQAIRLDGYLMAKEIKHELHIYGDKKHPRGHVFHCNIKDSIAQQCNLDEINFFKKYLAS